MPTFTYVARDRQGIVQTGMLDVSNEDDAVASLQRRGLFVTSLMRREAAAGSAAPAAPMVSRFARRMHGRVTVDDQVFLCQGLATLVDAGVPLLRSLEVVMAQAESRTLVIALERVHQDVGAGSTLVDALSRHPAIFSKLWVNLAGTGEASGHLAQSLTQLARHFESVRHLRNEAQTALTYPAFLIGVAIIVTGVFVYWLIPQFDMLFKSMSGIELPLITRLVIGASHFARQYFIVCLLGAVGLGYALRRYLRTASGQWFRDRLMLQLPLFRTLTAHVQLAEFANGLGTLLESGVPLLSTLEILESGATNHVYGQAIGHVREQVKEGKTMAEPMAKSGMFPPIVVQMIQVGEEIGEMAKMAQRLARYYEERVSTLIARMTRLFEPIALLVMAGMVLVLVLSIFLPILQISTGGGLTE